MISESSGGIEHVPDECITCGDTPQPHGSDCWECPGCGLTGCGIGGCEPESDRPFQPGNKQSEGGDGQ